MPCNQICFFLQLLKLHLVNNVVKWSVLKQMTCVVGISYYICSL